MHNELNNINRVSDATSQIPLVFQITDRIKMKLDRLAVALGPVLTSRIKQENANKAAPLSPVINDLNDIEDRITDLLDSVTL